MRLACVLLLIVGLYFALVDSRSEKAFAESGLEAALAKLEVGAGVSSQYHTLLVQSLSQAEKAYSATLSGDAQGGLDRLKVASLRASAAVHELMARAPEDSKVQRALDEGYRMMSAQLGALISSVKCRNRLQSSNVDGQSVWDKYYDAQSLP